MHLVSLLIVKITNWHIKVSEMVLEPIYNCLHQELSNQEVLHADETSYRVLNTHKEKTFYWLYASGKSEETSCALRARKFAFR